MKSMIIKTEIQIAGESANIATGNLDFLHFSSGNLNVFSMSLRK